MVSRSIEVIVAGPAAEHGALGGLSTDAGMIPDAISCSRLCQRRMLHGASRTCSCAGVSWMGVCGKREAADGDPVLAGLDWRVPDERRRSSRKPAYAGVGWMSVCGTLKQRKVIVCWRDLDERVPVR